MRVQSWVQSWVQCRPASVSTPCDETRTDGTVTAFGARCLTSSPAAWRWLTPGPQLLPHHPCRVQMESMKTSTPSRALCLLLTLLVVCATAHAQTAVSVGMTQLKTGDLPVTLVYPTLQPARSVALGPFVLQVAPDAVPQPGMRRLVVLSHGTGGNALSDHTLAVDPSWQPLLQLDKVGVHGMSAGGVTEAFLPANMRVLQGGITVDPAAGRADVRPDLRVAAVTLAVPVGAIFSADSLARIRVPVGLVTAGRDTMLLPEFHSDPVLRHCTACTRLADLKGAAHFDLLSPWPDAVALSVGAKQARSGQPEPGFDPKQRDDAFEAIARFFARQLQF